ncbi:uncharacterized protein LOC127711040 [Mytilus californianus]|uniref:uncharacterized protein LOC127711040 n=1 Tax=Mytilus californianus TaxID=6549 RepID=UPI002245FC4F|nr:uncharacterized protein LOC127711040 [Mytilus californianus]
MIKSENVNSMSESDSSEEDIEEKSRLLEAVVNVIPQYTSKHALINQTDVTLPVKENLKERRIYNLPSNRPLAVDKEEENGAFTPGVRKFVASKLSEQLDKEIELTDSRLNGTNEEITDTGIRLFSSSTRSLITDQEDNFITKQKKKRAVSSSSNSSEDERLAEAAVSHDFIIKQSQSTNGNQNGEPNLIVNISSDKDLNEIKKINENGTNNTVKKKKKKKKTKHKEEIKVS